MNRIHEVIQLAFGAFPFAISVVMAILGLLCLLFGKKFFWIAVGINAFIISYILIRVMFYWNNWSEHILAAGIGILAAGVSVVFKKFIVAINAFFIFGLLVAGVINEGVQFDEDSYVPLIVFFVTGSLIAFLAFRNLEKINMLSTSIIGGMALSIGVFKMFNYSPSSLMLFLIWIGLSAFGALFQSYYYAIPQEELEETTEFDNMQKGL